MPQDDSLRNTFSRELGENPERKLRLIGQEMDVVLLAISRLPNLPDFAAIREFQRPISEARMDIERIAQRMS